MNEASGKWLDDRRLHLQHGPIDLVIEATARPGHDVMRFYEAAITRFVRILGEIVSDLPILRSRYAPGTPLPRGHVARRMCRAVETHSGEVFITPMAAVAGAVSDEILETMRYYPGMAKAYVNNGGDIAIHLDEDQTFDVGIQEGLAGEIGKVVLTGGHGVGGVATSGRGGRSYSLGIADSVTVFAKTAASADAAATVVANAVDLSGHAGISRKPASELDEDSDLGDRLVVVGCAALSEDEIMEALGRGRHVANRLQAEGHIVAAALHLQGKSISVGKGTLPLGSDARES